jgi:aminoglycoside phosphotransferase family enzyme
MNERRMSDCRGSAQREIGIDRKVAFLGSPAAYPEEVSRVERIETHFSWVFLTDRHVYKLKKPLLGDGFDFSSPAARRRNAEAEVRLNRRLARDVYIGVVPLTLGVECDLAIGGPGVAIDWLVKMVRLPAGRMLDRRLARGDWHRADMSALADRLARFFATARRVKIPLPVFLARFHAECRDSRRALQSSGGSELQHAVQYVVRRIEAFLYGREYLLRQRLDEGRLVEGHGDLRPEHICLGATPTIIDCLEFRADLRFLDPVDELAFLTMECERVGARSVGQVLFHRYCLRAHDSPPSELTAFYKVIGALIRARIAILHLQESPVRDLGKWPKRAAEYLAIATRAAQQLAS